MELKEVREHYIHTHVQCPHCQERIGISFDTVASIPAVSKLETALPAEQVQQLEPSYLDGRKVDGYGWKLFEIEGNQLYSELEGRSCRSLSFPGEETSLPQENWLHYTSWGRIAKPTVGFHILKSSARAAAWKRLTTRGRTYTIRRIAWRKQMNPKPDYVDGPFLGDIFTAEEIYILPEEGMPTPPAAHLPNLVGQERPPEKGDWLYRDGPYWPARPVKVKDTRWTGAQCQWQCEHDGYWYDWDGSLKVVRRAKDPLREKDKVAFGSKEGVIVAVYVAQHGRHWPQCKVDFEKDNTGWINWDDLTLVEPFYEPKGDC
jgi:hypothetical protein